MATSYTLEYIKDLARRLSMRPGSNTMHVNRAEEGAYYISDWYSSEDTVASYFKGEDTTHLY